MDSTEQLLQLAHLLHLGAEALRQIASLRPGDQADLAVLSNRIASAADGIDHVAGRGWRN